jgi:ferric-dicitrate binding protein FerR (iron transport regulator)
MSCSSCRVSIRSTPARRRAWWRHAGLREGKPRPSPRGAKCGANVADDAAPESATPDVVEPDTARIWTHVEASKPSIGEPAQAGGSGRLLLFAAAVATAAATVLTLGFRSDSRLTYELRGAAAEHGMIEARRGEATVALSDGSSILAENSTKFGVSVVGRNSALTQLAAGKLHVRVVHNEDTSYRFVAGPYEVRVVGTEFDLAWEPTGAGLSLSMSKGAVRLLEPGGKVRILKAGQSLNLPASGAVEPAGDAPGPPDVSAPTLDAAVP